MLQYSTVPGIILKQSTVIHSDLGSVIQYCTVGKFANKNWPPPAPMLPYPILIQSSLYNTHKCSKSCRIVRYGAHTFCMTGHQSCRVLDTPLPTSHMYFVWDSLLRNGTRWRFTRFLMTETRSECIGFFDPKLRYFHIYKYGDKIIGLTLCVF